MSNENAISLQQLKELLYDLNPDVLNLYDSTLLKVQDYLLSETDGDLKDPELMDILRTLTEIRNNLKLLAKLSLRH